MLLLIARKNGRSRTRRQRRFADRAAVDAAVIRWRARGFNVWWIFQAGGGGLLDHWVDGAQVDDELDTCRSCGRRLGSNPTCGECQYEGNRQ